MMNSRYDNKHQWLWVFVIFIGISLTSLPTKVYDLFEKPIQSIQQNVSENYIETGNFFERMFQRKKLQEENALLKKQLRTLEVDAMRTDYLQSVLSSYEVLQSQELIPALVLSQYPFTPSDHFIIDKVAEVGDLVVTDTSVLLGEVVDVFDASSLVRLYTHPKSVIQSVTYPEAELIQIQGSSVTYRAKVSRDSEIVVGSYLYSQEYPGYLLGIVQGINFDPRDPFKDVVISRPLSGNITSVGIKKK